MKTFQSWWRLSLQRAAGPVGVGVVCATVLIATAASAQNYNAPNYNDRSRRCQDLERQLVSDWHSGNNPRDAVGGLDQQLAELERNRRRAESEAEQRECYEDMFLFGRSLKRTPACVRLDEEIEGARRNIANLRQQRDAMTSSASKRQRHDELVAELARAGCGENYSREYENQQQQRRPASSGSIFSLWQDNESTFDNSYANTQPNQTNLPFTSYRTMCVRLCDGYYFPISFSTLGSRFKDDEAKCREQCAAPAELYVYKNPGEEIEQMVSMEGRPYNELKTAWRNRKVFVKGCSCKPDEYSPQELAASDPAAGKQGAGTKTAGPSGAERGGVKSFDEPSGNGAKGNGKPQ